MNDGRTEALGLALAFWARDLLPGRNWLARRQGCGKPHDSSKHSNTPKRPPQEPRSACVPYCREHGRGCEMDGLSIICGHADQCPPPRPYESYQAHRPAIRFRTCRALPCVIPWFRFIHILLRCGRMENGNEVLEALTGMAGNAWKQVPSAGEKIP